jgi:molybdopterin-guanine dinucleotide biosynthesis protein A
MISANDPEPYRMLGCPLLPDRYAGCGPLGGIEAAMEFAVGQGLDNAGRVLFVPCDMPGITGLEMTALRVAAKENGLAMALFAGEAQPLVCAVSPVWLPAIREALEARRCSVLGLWERCGAVRVKMPSAQAGVNLNTGSDVDEWFRPPGGVTA